MCGQRRRRPEPSLSNEKKCEHCAVLYSDELQRPEQDGKDSLLIMFFFFYCILLVCPKCSFCLGKA